MRLEFLSIADAANNAADGKLNALGLGTRIVNVTSLPAGMPLAIVGSVSASVEEAGEYDLDLLLVEPDGTEVPLVATRATVPSEVMDSRVPTGAGFVVAWLATFRIEGVHMIRARFGDVHGGYDFVVRLTRSTPEPVTSVP